jgi:phosphatidylinositol alpha-mannosyltransferase
MFTTSLPEVGRKPGGVDVLIDRLATELTRRGHEVRIWSYSPPPPEAPYGHVALGPRAFTFSRAARTVIVPARLNAVDFSFAQVLHLHGDDWFFLRRRLPTVRTLYGSALFEARFAESLKRKFSQTIQVPLEILSSHLATASYGMIPGDAPIHRTCGWLPGGVDMPEKVRQKRSDRPAILFVGTWGGRKRGKLLFETFEKEIRPAVPDAELWMVSDHAERGAGVTWYPAPSNAEIAELQGQAWAFCLPSRYEGFGLPYLEALAHGTPVVTSDNPGARFVLRDGALGVITEDDGIGPALVSLLRDPGSRSALSEAGRKRASELTWDSAARLHELAYADAISRRSADHAYSSGPPRRLASPSPLDRTPRERE